LRCWLTVHVGLLLRNEHVSRIQFCELLDEADEASEAFEEA
jgi:hypothetical protein